MTPKYYYYTPEGRFASLREASDATGLLRGTLKNRCLSKKLIYKEYIREDITEYEETPDWKKKSNKKRSEIMTGKERGNWSQEHKDKLSLIHKKRWAIIKATRDIQ